MYTPIKAQWQLVIDNFKLVLPMATSNLQLDMGEGRVNYNGYQCGTCHCVGGWYAIAVLSRDRQLDYFDGANAMAAHLGFRGRIHLEAWAAQNPNIWGNHYGGDMFGWEKAYGFEIGGLTDVVTHLEGVRDRSPE